MVKLPSQMATWLSPNGSVKKHNLYSKHPRAWESKARVNPVTQTNVKDSRINTRAHRVTTDPVTAVFSTGGSTARLTHPDICFCGDDLVVVEIHHLGGSI